MPDNDHAWSATFDKMKENDNIINKKYRDFLPYPKGDITYQKSWSCKRERQVATGKEQHDWIVYLPENHFLRHIYFAVMSLFEEWKRPTYIRDQYFNMNCRNSDNPERMVEYTDCYSQLKQEEHGLERQKRR